MDPLTAATTFATIVGLICNFKQEHSGNKEADHRLFMDWLMYHKHEALAQQISETRDWQAEIDRILKSDHDEVMSALAGLSTQIAQLSSAIGTLHGLAVAVAPSSSLSEQAISVLKQLVHSGGKELAYIPSFDGVAFQTDNGRAIEITEERFLEDDLDVLVSLGLLTPRHGTHGTAFNRITRAALSLVRPQ